MPTMHLRFYTRSSPADEPVVFFRTLEQTVPRTLPEKFFRKENQKQNLDLRNLDALAALWRENIVYWTSKKPHIYGFASFGTPQLHTGILHTFDVSLASDDDICTCLSSLSQALSADYAFAHPLPDKGMKKSSEDESIGASIPRTLPNGLPGVPWVACYGPPYVKCFGRSVIKSLPAAEIRHLKNKSVMCRLTTSSGDSIERTSEFLERQAATHERLSPEAFYDRNQPSRKPHGPAFAPPIVAANATSLH